MSSNNRWRLLWIAVIALVAAWLGWQWESIDPVIRALVLGLSVVALGFTLIRDGDDAEDERSDDALSRLHDMVLADESRRPWDPTTLPWRAPTPDERPVLLVPAADYHLADVVPLSNELNRAGIPTRIAIGVSPWERTWPAFHWYDHEVYALPEPEEIAGKVAAVLVMKDTGSLGPFVQRCRELGIPTIGKVEGAQDFWDADTPEERRPYRNLDLVLCQGQFDADALSDRPTAIVGSTRLERLWWAPPVTVTEPLAVINLNFVYGVRTADRKLWLETAIEGCERARIPYVISVHPAEKARVDSDRVTAISASRLLPRASVLISRFSTMPFEAMARGVPFIYHNPHGETVKTFADPMGAFDVTSSAAELSDAVSKSSDRSLAYRFRCESFFLDHVDVKSNRRSDERTAETVTQWVAG